MPHTDPAGAAALPPAPPTALHQALRHAARAAPGHAALRVRVTTGPDAAPRLVRHLLDQAAGGQGVHALGPADFLLAEAPAQAAREVRGAIATLLPGPAMPEFTQWALPEDGTALLALAEEAAAQHAAPPPAAPALRGLDALADQVPLGAVVRRNPVLLLRAPGEVRTGPLRLGLRQEALRQALGPPGADPDLLRHARDRIAQRMIAALTTEAARRDLLGTAGRRQLIVELPQSALPVRSAGLDEAAEAPPPAAPPSLFAALPPTVAADPDLLARWRVALEAHGWGLALRGVTAALLGAVAAEALAADLLLLRWSPALAGRGPAAALRRLDPARLLLLGADEEEAIGWGLGQGIRQFGGAHPELILAAARMAACPARARCTRRQCIQRAAATTDGGRDGCTERELLAAVLPAPDGDAA